jgi:hypothetical protein
MEAPSVLPPYICERDVAGSYWRPYDVTSWNFLTNHARAMLCIADDPQVRLRDIASSLGITERRAYGIVCDLTEAGYLIKDRDGRRNRYQVQADRPLPDALSREQAIGDVLRLLMGRE